MNSPSIAATFHKSFKVVHADTPALQREVYRIRYEVYCEELHFEEAAEFPDRLEHDSYDERSHHCLLVHRDTKAYAGCVRMVFNDRADSNQLLPFEQHCASSLRREALDLQAIDRESIGEVSRLAIPAYFRRRKGDLMSPLGEISDAHRATEEDKRKFHCMAPGLYLAAASIGMHAGLKYVFAMMEPRLARHLISFGIRFQQIGDVVDYHGPRAAYYIEVDTLYESLPPEIRDMLDIIHSDLDTDIRH